MGDTCPARRHTLSSTAWRTPITCDAPTSVTLPGFCLQKPACMHPHAAALLVRGPLQVEGPGSAQPTGTRLDSQERNCTRATIARLVICAASFLGSPV